jgi:hypothetical protein
MQQQELHSTIEQHRAAQWAGSINEIDESFPHFKVAKDLSNNLVKWQVLATSTDVAQTLLSYGRRLSLAFAIAWGLEAQSPNSFD